MSAQQEVFPGWEGMMSPQAGSASGGPGQENGLEDLIRNGLTGSGGNRMALPARHFSSILNQIAFARLARLDAFNTLLAPFAREDGLTLRELKQGLQGLAFAFLYRSKEQDLPCMRIGLDPVCPERLRDMKAVVAGKELPYTYGALESEAGEIARALREVLDEGNSEGEPFSCIAPLDEADSWIQVEGIPQGISYEMFTMKTCKKCAAVRDFMALSHLEGNEVNVDSDRGFDRASEAGVFVTPTVIFYNREKEELARAHNVQELESVLVLLKGRQ
ncbi:MAG: hypothetical protein K6G18_10935 [Treponema sp.]|nr:hypothetical protein [Treponema sp.]